ncbi:MAG: hypothetical protein L3J67_07835 [Hyphomicrobiaceae bacterium]|nr:hypothetical protein [Hyphomicrobiaceae bacterium]
MNMVAPRIPGPRWAVMAFFLAALLLAVLFLAVRAPVQAAPRLPQTAPQLIIALDSSSSMEDELDSELKYKLVRRAFGKALPLYEGKLQAGLLVFGSKQKNSCTDITHLMGPTTSFSKSLPLALQSQKPRGKSPIGATLVKAANMTNALANRSDILLIADGSDNCRVNVCSVAKALADRSPETRIHLIGLGRSGTINRLDCITKATNGLFFAIRNQREMVTALKKVMQAVMVKNPPARTNLIARTMAMLMGPPPPPTKRPPHKIARYQKPLAAKAPIITGALKIPAAKPTAKKQKATALKKAALKKQPPLKKLRVTSRAVTTAAQLQKTKRSDKKKVPQAAPVKWQSFSNKIPPPLIAQPSLKQAIKENRRARPIRLAQNLPQKQLSSPQNSTPRNTTLVQLAALITEEGKEIKNGLVWRIYNANKSLDGRYKLVKSLEAPRFSGTLPLGTYLVNLSWGRSHLTEKLELLSSKPLIHKFVLNAGGLRLGARHMNGSTLPPQKVIYRIYSDERDQFGRRRLVLDHARPGKTIRLNAGIYHVSSLYGSANGLIESDITIEAGKLTQATINHTASKVTFKLVNTPGGEALAGAIWRIETPDGDLIKETAGALPTLILAAGDYAINAKYSGRAFARKVTIEPGAPVHVEIVIQ